jgi:hypothetical protein
MVQVCGAGRRSSEPLARSPRTGVNARGKPQMDTDEHGGRAPRLAPCRARSGLQSLVGLEELKWESGRPFASRLAAFAPRQGRGRQDSSRKGIRDAGGAFRDGIRNATSASRKGIRDAKGAYPWPGARDANGECQTRRRVADGYCIVKSKVSIRNDLHSLPAGRQVRMEKREPTGRRKAPPLRCAQRLGTLRV